MATTTTRLDDPHQGPWCLSITELSERLGVPVSTLRAWRTDGKGPTGYILGRHLRYLAEDVVEWLKSQPTQAVFSPHDHTFGSKADTPSRRNV